MQRSVAAAAAFLAARQTLWPVQQLATPGLLALQSCPQQPQWQQQQQHCLQDERLHQLQQARSMSFSVTVDRNNVEKALRQLNRHWQDAGMPEELRSREYRKTSSDIKLEARKAAHNKRMGVLIAQRLKWVVRRRKLKM